MAALALVAPVDVRALALLRRLRTRARALGCGTKHYWWCRIHDGCLLAQAADFVESVLTKQAAATTPQEAQAILDEIKARRDD